MMPVRGILLSPLEDYLLEIASEDMGYVSDLARTAWPILEETPISAAGNGNELARSALIRLFNFEFIEFGETRTGGGRIVVSSAEELLDDPRAWRQSEGDPPWLVYFATDAGKRFDEEWAAANPIRASAQLPR